jgi:hypothetical protein
MSLGSLAGTTRSGGRIPLEFQNVDFIPQAIFRGSVEHFARILSSDVTHGSDDLDEFYGLAFLSESAKVPVAVRHYAGHPEDTVSVYLPREIEDVEDISRMIELLMKEFRLSPADKIWERRDDPGL